MNDGTYDGTSEKHHRHLRKLERAHRLAEIDVAYQNVIEEAKQRQNNIYKTVFIENEEIDPAVILEMQHLAQYQIDQEKRGNFCKRVKRCFSFKSAPVAPFIVQSQSQPPGASLPTASTGAISAKNGDPHKDYPLSTFKKEEPAYNGEKSCCARHRNKINFLLSVTAALLIAIGLILSIPDLRDHFIVIKAKKLES